MCSENAICTGCFLRNHCPHIACWRWNWPRPDHKYKGNGCGDDVTEITSAAVMGARPSWRESAPRGTGTERGAFCTGIDDPILLLTRELRGKVDVKKS
jgi:hypothetical protein